jgi:hypothetical protein
VLVRRLSAVCDDLLRRSVNCLLAIERELRQFEGGCGLLGHGDLNGIMGKIDSNDPIDRLLIFSLKIWLSSARQETPSSR